MAEADWTSTTQDIKWELNNREVILRNIPVRVNKKAGVSTVKIRDMIKAERALVAQESNLNEREEPILAVLWAEMPILHGINVKIKLNVNEGEVRQSRRMHKLLFDVWQKTLSTGYGNLYPHDSFNKEVFGPVAVHLKEDLEDLEKKGLIVTSWEKGHKAPTVISLTKKGNEVAKMVWNDTPKEVKEIMTASKEFFVFKDINEIVEYFHKKYPDYQKIKPQESEK